MTAAKIYQMIYHPEKTTNTQVFEYVKPSVVETPRVSDKKQEIVASLNYLKNKNNLNEVF